MRIPGGTVNDDDGALDIRVHLGQRIAAVVRHFQTIRQGKKSQNFGPFEHGAAAMAPVAAQTEIKTNQADNRSM